MKKTILAVASASLSLVLAAVLVSSAAAAKDPFIGRWHSTDVVDGSSQTMSIGGGPAGTRMVRYHDDGASACGVDESDQPIYAARVSGVLTESGNTLSGTVDVTCLTIPPSAGPTGVAITFTYSAGTLLDSFGTTWYRGP